MRMFTRAATAAALSVSLSVLGLAPALAEQPVAPDPASPSAQPLADQTTAEPEVTEEPEVAEEAEVTEEPDVTDGYTEQRTSPSKQASPHAAASDSIVKPADGSTVAKGPLAYTVVASGPGDYMVELDCESTWDYAYLSASYAGQQLSGTLDSVSSGDDCTLTLTNEQTWRSVTSSFTVKRTYPTPQVRNLSIGNSTFYPLVRDRYKDRAKIKFGSRLDSNVTISIVRKSTGRTVRTITRKGSTWRDWYQRRSIGWDGRNKNGNTVPVGRYTAIVKSKLGGKTATARAPIWVDTGFRTRNVTKTKHGWYDSKDKTTAACYAWEHTYPSGIWLNCWGGGYAEARYNFRLPSNATNVRYEVRGKHSCCDQGKLTRVGQRLNPTSYQVRVRVTYWRAYIVKKVLLRYRVRERI